MSQLPPAIAEVFERRDLFYAADARDYSARLWRTLALMSSKRELIEETLQYTSHSHTYDELVYKVVHGALLFWDLGDSFLLTEVITYPQHSALHVFMGGGSMETVTGIEEELMTFARALGCTRLTVSGRPGWAAIASRRQGWEQMTTTVTRSVP